MEHVECMKKLPASGRELNTAQSKGLEYDPFED
jgi:hypothetical protein